MTTIACHFSKSGFYLVPYPHNDRKKKTQKFVTSASLRFSGLTLTLLEMDSRTSAVLEFSLLTLTKN